MTYISIKNQEKMTGLTRDNIIDVMLTGINFLDASILTYVSKIDGFEQEIMFDNESLVFLSEKVSHNDFNITIVGSVIKIENEIMPPSLFFLLKDWKQMLESKVVYNPDFNVLIPHRNHGPMFIGEETVIERLSENFDGNYDIIVLRDVEKG